MQFKKTLKVVIELFTFHSCDAVAITLGFISPRSLTEFVFNAGVILLLCHRIKNLKKFHYAFF